MIEAPEGTGAVATDGQIDDVSPPTRRRLPLLLLAVAGLLLVAGTIGPPLVGRGVFLPTDALSSAYPWRATQDPVAANYAHHGEVGDTVDTIFPSRALFAEAARDGDFLGWAPWSAGGTALGGTGAVATLSPTQLLFVALPTWYAPAAVKVLQMAVAIGFTYLFCRRLGVDRLAAGFGGLAFAGSGFMVMWTNWPHPEVAALIPALFWAVERFLQRPSARTAPPIAVVVLFLLLGNFPAIVFHAFYVLGPYVLVRTIAVHRASLRRVARSLAGSAGAIVTGVLLSSVALLPFYLRLSFLGASSRAQTPGLNLGLETLLTTVAPKSLGLSTEAPAAPYFGRYVQIETVAFFGASTVILALIAVALPRPAAALGQARAVFGIATAVIGWATFTGGVVLRILQRLPGFEESFVGRTRAVLGFMVAVLAAIGLQSVLDRRWPADRRQWARVVVVVVVAGLVGTIALERARDVEQAAGLTGALSRALQLPVAVALVTIAVLAVVRFGSRQTAALASGALPVLLVVEALALALPLLPNEDRSTVYPTTPGIDFLAANIGHDRVAAQDLTLYAGATGMFGLRQVTGHNFYSPTWKHAVTAIDPDAFSRSGTFAFLDGSSGVVTSPVLDRLGARWFAAVPGTLPVGERDTTNAAAATCDQSVDLVDQETVTLSVPAEDGLRGLVLDVCGPSQLPEPAAIAITVPDASAAGRRPLPETVQPGELALAVPGAEVGRRGDIEVQLTLTGGGGSSLRLAAQDDGRPVTDPVRPAEDGLRVAYAGDLIVYERTNALPRIRWAGTAEVEIEPLARLERLAEGTLPADVVLLSDDGPTGSGTAGVVDVRLDTPTSITVDVTAEGDGYLVVADAIQHGWRAEVDGRTADLVAADHAGVAVHVPDGNHTVTLRYRAPGQRAGLAVSAVTLVGLVGVWTWAEWRHRRSRSLADRSSSD
jgi:hypothetical protein